jgi:diguanylate cyclase (GGDEF)-like protein
MLSDIATPLPEPVTQAGIAHLARAVLAELDLPITPQYLHLFGQVYRHYLEAVPNQQRDGKRLVDMYRACVGLPPLRAAAAIDPERVRLLEEELDHHRRQERIYAEREEEWSNKVERLRFDLRHARDVVTNLYAEMKREVEAERQRLHEREGLLREQENGLQERLTAIQEAERRLLPEVEERVRRELSAVMELEVKEVRQELETVSAELADVVQQMAATDEPGAATPLVAAIRKLKEEAGAAGIDPLTGLATRVLFERDLEHAQATYQDSLCDPAGGDSATGFALLYVDLDGLKPINDHNGHATGDALIQAVGRTLIESLRESDRPFRHGDDEFVVLLTDTDGEGAAVTAEQVRSSIEALRVPTASGTTVGIGASIGIADAAECGRAVVHCADLAQYRAKEEGGNQICRYRDKEFAPHPPEGLTEVFYDEIRTRLRRDERLTIAALHTPSTEDIATVLPELRAQVQEIFPEGTIERVGDDLFVLLGETDAEEAAATIGSHIEGIATTAGATDVDEISGPDLASPGARAAELLNTSLAIAREQTDE